MKDAKLAVNHPPALATAAMKDLIDFVALTEDEPAAALAFKECFEIGTPIITCHLDADATVVTGKPVFHFELQETLMRYLAAFRARQRKDTDG